eukprot:TRINITY_DN25045_c0_g1_i1.p1 TRINITY_DN25045_c0_g1~~TRINITY_DN25045_c0_g1_i1.p1  ORF type:complete len:372 (-),score=12.35 TRINITY_DN25045_c0_g1_i1:236-1351(-)
MATRLPSTDASIVALRRAAALTGGSLVVSTASLGSSSSYLSSADASVALRKIRDTAALLVPGACAGVACAFACNPVDVLKNRLQSSFSSASVTGEISAIFRARGVRGFYAGLPASIISLGCTRAFYFALYSASLGFFTSRLAPHGSRSPQQATPWYVTACAAATTALAINITFSPIFVVRTLQFLIPASSLGSEFTAQGRKASIAECVRLVRRSAGWRGFYRGLSPSLIGIGETATFWVLYEATKALPWFAANSARSAGVCTDGQTEETRFRRFARWSATVVGASVVARTAATLIWYPHEVLRTRMRESVIHMARGDKSAPPRLAASTREIFRGGVRTAWAGCSVHLFRQIPTTVVTWYVYELVRSSLAVK